MTCNQYRMNIGPMTDRRLFLYMPDIGPIICRHDIGQTWIRWVKRYQIDIVYDIYPILKVYWSYIG